MKAVRLTSPKTFEFVEVETPSPADGQCLIKVERVSVCGSDIRSTYGEIHPEEEYPMAPGRPCHEVAGVVVESRSDAFKVGQRAIVIPGAGQGGLGEYLTSGPERMALLPEHGSLDEWVMCQPSGTVLFSCQQMPNLLGKNVLVMGQGSIGLSFTMITSRIGARNVIAADLLDYRLEKSKEFGATHVINASRTDPVEAIHEITNGGVDFAIDAIGVKVTNEQILPATRGGGPGADNHGGMAILIGLPGWDITVDSRLFVSHQRQYRGSLGATYPDKDFPMFLRWHREGKFPLDKLVTRRYRLDNINEACSALEAGEILGRAIIEY